MNVALLSLLFLGSVTGYDFGKEYLYTYDGSISITHTDSPSVRLEFRSKVLVQPKHNHTHFKIVDFEFHTDRRDTFDYTKRDAVYHASPALKDDVEKVFAATLTDGKFESIEFDKTDGLMSRNIKRALVSLFQVNLSHGSSEYFNATEYKTFEESIDGECETQYVVADSVDGGYIEVTKVRNLQNCLHSPRAFYGSFRGQECHSCESKDKHPLVMDGAVHYRLRREGDGFVIKEASSTARKTYNPFHEGKVVLMAEQRTLRLLHEQEGTTNTTTAADAEVYTSLGEEQQVSTSLRHAEELRAGNAFISAYLGTSDEAFLKRFQELVNVDSGEEDHQYAPHRENAAQKFLEVYFLALALSYDQTDEFYKTHVQNAPEDRKEETKHLFLDLLSATGVNQHVAYGLHLIQAGQLNDEEAKRFFNRLPMNVLEPSEAVLRAVLDVCKTEFVKKNRNLEESCLLAVASLIESDCQRAESDEKTDGGLCRPDIVELFFDYSVDPANDYIRTSYLEIGGKIATRQAVRKLARFASPKVTCPIRRLDALWALGQAGPKQPHLVRHIVLPIYSNTSESHSIRIAAFLAIVSTSPDLYLLRDIARRIVDDPSDQLASFVTSFFREVAKTKYPCYSGLARKLKYVNPIWNHVSRFARKPEHTQSRFTMSSTYNEKYNYGGTTEASTIMSDVSYLPQSVHYKIKDYFAGFSHDTLSVTYDAWGVDRLLASFVAPSPGSRRNLWDIYGKHRVPRGADERHGLNDSLPITPRDYLPLLGRVKLGIWGHTVETWYFGQNLLDAFKEPSKLGTLRSSHHRYIAKANKRAPKRCTTYPLSQAGDNLVEKFADVFQGNGNREHFYVSPIMFWMFPTDTGLPAFLELRQSNYFHVNHHQVTFQEEDGKMQLGLQRQYQYETYSFENFGFGLIPDSLFLGTGYEKKLSVSLPLKVQVTYDTKTHKLSLEVPLSLPADLVKYSFEPYTNLAVYNTTSNLEGFFVPIYKKDELVSYNKQYLTDFMGFGFDVKSYLYPKALKESLHDFWHNLNFREKMYYLDANPHWHPRFLSVQAIPAEKDATHTLQLDIGYKTKDADDIQHDSNVTEECLGNATSLRLDVDVLFKGNTKTRSIRTELQVTNTRDLLKHWVRFRYDRSPFHEGEQDHTKVCLDTAAIFPKSNWASDANIGSVYQGYTIDAKATLVHGINCANGSRITLRGTYEHTDADAEEISDIVHDSPPSTGMFKQNLLRKLYEECSFHKDQGIRLSHQCVQYLYHSSRLGKLNLDVEYHDLEKADCQYLGALLHPSERQPGFFGAVLSHFDGTEGKLRVVSQVPAHTGFHGEASLTVKTADGHVYQHDHVPTYTHLLEPRVFDFLSYSNLQEYSSKYKHETCDLQGRSVRTFDGVLVPLPDTDCFQVVARDCSPSNHFTVLAKPTNFSTFPKAKVIKVVLENTVIEVFPSADVEGVIVERDGERVAVVSNYTLNAKPDGLYVFFDGDALFVQVAPFYRGKLCGLCGDYNYDRLNELRGPDKHLYHDALEFAKSYVVPSDDCHQP